MAKTIREMFPRERTLYTVSSVEKLIADYLNAGGEITPRFFCFLAW